MYVDLSCYLFILFYFFLNTGPWFRPQLSNSRPRGLVSCRFYLSNLSNGTRREVTENLVIILTKLQGFWVEIGETF